MKVDKSIVRIILANQEALRVMSNFIDGFVCCFQMCQGLSPCILSEQRHWIFKEELCPAKIANGTGA